MLLFFAEVFHFKLILFMLTIQIFMLNYVLIYFIIYVLYIFCLFYYLYFLFNIFIDNLYSHLYWHLYRFMMFIYVVVECSFLNLIKQNFTKFWHTNILSKYHCISYKCSFLKVLILKGRYMKLGIPIFWQVDYKHPIRVTLK